LPPRANWKGFPKIAEAPCFVFAAASTTERVVLLPIGHRVRRQYVAGERFEGDDQLKGYEVPKDQYASTQPIIQHGEKTPKAEPAAPRPKAG